VHKVTQQSLLTHFAGTAFMNKVMHVLNPHCGQISEVLLQVAVHKLTKHE
jgi:hypothetical protein